MTAGAAWRRRAAAWRAGGLALVVLGLALYLPGVWSIPPVDRDESRFAQASAQMPASGTLEGWIVPRVQEKPRLNKPPLIYWLQAASAWACGVEEGARRRGAEGIKSEETGPTTDPEHDRAGSSVGSPVVTSSSALPTAGIWAYRLPSVLCAILSILLTWRLGLRLFDPRAAWLGAALLASCVMQLWDARQARADQLLLTVTLGAQLALWSLWRQRHRPGGPPPGRAVLFWALIGLGVMSKGPITPLVSGLTALSLAATTGEWRWLLRLRPLLGAAIAGAIVLPWAALVMREVGAAEYLSIIADETLGRGARAKEGHWGPPGYHTVMLAVMFWPGSLLTLAAIGRGWSKARRRFTAEAQRTQRSEREDVGKSSLARRTVRALRLRGGRPETFLLCWIAPAWIVFELIGTKLPHYTLPMYPAIALLTARAVFAAEAGRSHPAARGERPRAGLGISLGGLAWLLIGAAFGVAGPAALLWSGELADAARPAAVTLAGAFTLLMFGGAINLRAGRVLGAHWSAIGATILASTIWFDRLLPGVPSIWLSARLVREIERIDPARQRPLAASGYAEDSLIFMTRGAIVKLAPGDAGAWLAAHPDGLLVVRRRDGEADDAGATRPLAAVSGFNYANGERTTLELRTHEDRPAAGGG